MSSSESNVFDVRLNLRGKKGGGFREAIELMFEDDGITKRLFRIGMYRVIDVLEIVQIHPEKEIIIEFIENSDYKYIFETKVTKQAEVKGKKTKDSKVDAITEAKPFARLQECGPRFTLKLINLQHGTFDPRGGEFEWVHKKSMETLIDWIDSEVNMSNTYVLFRTYAPVHFRILNGEDVDIEETVLRTPISKS